MTKLLQLILLLASKQIGGFMKNTQNHINCEAKPNLGKKQLEARSPPIAFSICFSQSSHALHVLYKKMCFRGRFVEGAFAAKKGVDCIFAVFYSFLLKSISFDIRHAKCDLTVKNKWKMRLGSILPRAASCQNWISPRNLDGFMCFS